MKVLCAGKECGALDVLTEAEFGASSGPCSGDSGGPALGCFSTDAGVDDPMFVTLVLKSGLQQMRP